MSHAGARLLAVVGLMLGIIASPGAAGAQAPGGVHRVGILWGLTRGESTFLLREVVEGLRELGYHEGRHVVFEHPWCSSTGPGSSRPRGVNACRRSTRGASSRRREGSCHTAPA